MLKILGFSPFTVAKAIDFVCQLIRQLKQTAKNITALNIKIANSKHYPLPFTLVNG